MNDLCERMRLLQQDRRANVNLLEANKAANAEEIRVLREDNKQLRMKLTCLQKNHTINHGGKYQSDGLRKELLRAKTEHDSLRVLSEKHKKQLTKVKDAIKNCELEARRPNHDDSPLSRRIRTLKNR